MERKAKTTMTNPYPKLEPTPVPIPQPMLVEKPWPPWSKPTAYTSSANATASSSVSFPLSRENFQKSHTQRVSSQNEPEPAKAWPSLSVLASTSESRLKPKPKPISMDADAELLFGHALASAYNKQSASGLRPAPAFPYSASLARSSNKVFSDAAQNRLPLANHSTKNKSKPPLLPPLSSTKVPNKAQTDPQPNGFKSCTKCHRPTVRADDSRKQCERCRAYGRDATRRAKARQSEKAQLLFGCGCGEDLDVPDAAEAEGVDKQKAKEKARKASKVFGHVESKSENGATPSGTLEEMRKRLKTSLKEKQKQKQSNYSANFHSSAVSASASDMNTSLNVADAEAEADFQTASEMYAQLRIARRTPRFEFRGSFSIVRVARVDDAARERLVVEELRKIARLKFRHDKPFLFRSGVKQHLAFPCSCLTAQPATFGVGTSPSSTLAPAQPFIECGGTVIVHAQEDHSNPYMQGQKVTVCIEHPAIGFPDGRTEVY